MNSVGQEVFIECDTHARCFDSLAVSNNIRYFYHISVPLAPWPLFGKEHVLVLES